MPLPWKLPTVGNQTSRAQTFRALGGGPGRGGQAVCPPRPGGLLHIPYTRGAGEFHHFAGKVQTRPTRLNRPICVRMASGVVERSLRGTMESKTGKWALVACLLMSHVATAGCASDTPERRQPRSVARRSAHFFEVECEFGITGCESQASERCGYAGYHVLGSYRTQEGAFGSPYYYMKAACGPAPAQAVAPAAAPVAPVLSAGPAPVPERREPGPDPAFEVECRFGISGCESQASERCGYVGYHVLGSYKTQGAFGTPYYYMKAACGPAPTSKPPSPPGAQ